MNTSSFPPPAATHHYCVTSVDQTDGSNARSACFDALDANHAVELSKPSGIGKARYVLCEQLLPAQCNCGRWAALIDREELAKAFVDGALQGGLFGDK